MWKLHVQPSRTAALSLSLWINSVKAICYSEYEDPKTAEREEMILKLLQFMEQDFLWTLSSKENSQELIVGIPHTTTQDHLPLSANLNPKNTDKSLSIKALLLI